MRNSVDSICLLTLCVNSVHLTSFSPDCTSCPQLFTTSCFFSLFPPLTLAAFTSALVHWVLVCTVAPPPGKALHAASISGLQGWGSLLHYPDPPAEEHRTEPPHRTVAMETDDCWKARLKAENESRESNVFICPPTTVLNVLSDSDRALKKTIWKWVQ